MPTAAGDASREASQLVDQVLNLFQEASELPPTDKESRVVIAARYLASPSTRSQVGLARGSESGPEPGLMAAAGSDFDRSVAMFEKLLIEHSGDPLIRRYLADALGLGGMACHMKFTQRSEEAERLYLRAIKLRRDLVRVLRAGRRCCCPSASRRSWRRRERLIFYVHR